MLLADLFLPPSRKPLLGWITIAGLVAALASLAPLRTGSRSTFCLTATPDACSYTVDHFALVIQALVLGGALLTALLSVRDTKERLPAGEFWFLLLSSAAGAALLPAARDLATLVVALEVASLPAFALVGLKRGDRLSSEAALKFFLSSVTATAVMLLGVSFVYAATGTLHLTGDRHQTGHRSRPVGHARQDGRRPDAGGLRLQDGRGPFHFWVPDTYVGAPLPVAAYLSVVGKAVGFSGLILVTVVAFPSYADVWGPALAVLAALTMTVGNAAALRQSATRAYSAVRLLAWSSVGQAGYLLVPIAAAAYSAATGRRHRGVRPDVRRREPRRLRGRRPGGPQQAAEPPHRLPGPVRRAPPGRAGAGLLPAVPGRSSAGHHRPVRQGHRLLGGRRRGARLARGRHGDQRGRSPSTTTCAGPRSCSGRPRPPTSRRRRCGPHARASRPRSRSPSR